MSRVPTASAPDSAESLVPRAAHGDEAAFARIVRLYHADLVRVCFVIGGRRDLAEDAVTAAWPIAWRRLGRLRDPNRLRPLLCSVAADEAVALIRRARRRGSVEAASERAAPTPPDRAGNDADPEIAGALDRLAPDDRALLALRFVAGVGVTELGRATRTAPTAAEARLEGVLDDLSGELHEARSDGTAFEARLERWLGAYADIPVRPVDIDAIAGAAKAEQGFRRSQFVSVAAAALFTVLLMAAQIVAGPVGPARSDLVRGAGSPAASPTTPADGRAP